MNYLYNITGMIVLWISAAIFLFFFIGGTLAVFLHYIHKAKPYVLYFRKAYIFLLWEKKQFPRINEEYCKHNPGKDAVVHFKFHRKGDEQKTRYFCLRCGKWWEDTEYFKPKKEIGSNDDNKNSTGT